MMKINFHHTIKQAVGLSALLVLSTVAIAVPTRAEIAKNGLQLNGFTLNGFTLNGLRSNVITFNGLRFNNLLASSQILDTVSPLEPATGKSPPNKATLNDRSVTSIQLEGSELILNLQSAE